MYREGSKVWLKGRGRELPRQRAEIVGLDEGELVAQIDPEFRTGDPDLDVQIVAEDEIEGPA